MKALEHNHIFVALIMVALNCACSKSNFNGEAPEKVASTTQKTAGTGEGDAILNGAMSSNAERLGTGADNADPNSVTTRSSEVEPEPLPPPNLGDIDDGGDQAPPPTMDNGGEEVPYKTCTIANAELQIVRDQLSSQGNLAPSGFGWSNAQSKDLVLPADARNIDLGLTYAFVDDGCAKVWVGNFPSATYQRTKIVDREADGDLCETIPLGPIPEDLKNVATPHILKFEPPRRLPLRAGFNRVEGIVFDTIQGNRFLFLYIKGTYQTRGDCLPGLGFPNVSPDFGAGPVKVVP